MTKTKREFVKELSKVTKTPQREVGIIIEKFLDAISKTIVAGDRIELRKFGVFSAKRRRPKIARNPKTGEPVKLPERLVCVFKPSGFLNAKLK